MRILVKTQSLQVSFATRTIVEGSSKLLKLALRGVRRFVTGGNVLDESGEERIVLVAHSNLLRLGDNHVSGHDSDWRDFGEVV